MRRLPSFLLAAILTTFVACDDAQLTSPDLAQGGSRLSKKGGNPGGGGGPGGGEPTPPGVIYALLDNDRVELDADGAVLSTLDPVVKGHPTHEEHGGERWFVYIDDVAGVYPDSIGRNELFAVSESGTLVQLTTDPLLHPMIRPRWSPAPTDGQIAFGGRRFTSPTAAADEGGIYVADVEFGAGGPVVTAVNPRIAGIVTEDPTHCTSDGICYANSDLRQAEWSPDGIRIAFTVADQPEPTPYSLWIHEPDGTRSFVTARASAPRWSSQNVILFWRALFERTLVTRLLTIAPEGSGETEVVMLKDRGGQKWTSQRFEGFGWSPDGDHFVYAWRECAIWRSPMCEAELVRRKADGSGEAVLASTDWAAVQGWR